MIEYFEIKTTLTTTQKRKLFNAMRDKSSVSIKLNPVIDGSDSIYVNSYTYDRYNSKNTNVFYARLSNRAIAYNKKMGNIFFGGVLGHSISSDTNHFPIMSTDMINSELKDIPEFHGCYSNTNIKEFPSPYEAGVFNFDSPTGKGTHWTAWYISDKLKNNVYFDSYGGIIPENLLRYLKQNRKNVLCNTIQIQPYDTVMCGYYCCNFIRWMSEDKDFVDFIGQYDSNNLEENDEMTRHMFNQNKNIV